MDNKNLKLALCVGIPAAIIAAVVVLFLLNSGGGGSKSYMEVVPSSSVFAVKGNMGALLQKSEVLENQTVQELYSNLVDEAPEEFQSLLNDLYADPNSSGINVNEPVVFAITQVAPLNGVVVISLNDADTFKNLLNDVFEGDVEIEEEDGVNVIDMGGLNMAGVAFDDEKLVIAFTEIDYDNPDNAVDVMAYFQLESDEMAVNDDVFGEFFASNADFVAFGQAAPIAEQLSEGRNARRMREQIEVLETLGDVTYFSSLNFGDGCIESVQKIYTEEGKNSLKFIFDIIFEKVGDIMSSGFRF